MDLRRPCTFEYVVETSVITMKNCNKDASCRFFFFRIKRCEAIDTVKSE